MPGWWPPKVGDRLRTVDHRHVPILVHVVTVFEHAGGTRFVVAQWQTGRQRWYYEVVGPCECELAFARYWLDGTDHPDPTWRELLARRAAGTDPA